MVLDRNITHFILKLGYCLQHFGRQRSIGREIMVKFVLKKDEDLGGGEEEGGEEKEDPAHAD